MFERGSYISYANCGLPYHIGDVIKEMRKDQKFPSSMINVLEKFYVMSNIEPGVRHGSANRSRISIHDAELSLHIGVAFIRYLIAKYGK